MSSKLPIDRIVSIALHNQDVASSVSEMDDYHFNASPIGDQLRYVRDFLKLFVDSPTKPDSESFRDYARSLKLSPIERAAADQVFTNLLMSYKKTHEAMLPIYIKEHNETIKVERAKANLIHNPYAAIRDLRSLGYDEKKINDLRKGLAQKTNRLSSKSLMKMDQVTEEEPLIEGILRRGEVCNIVAAPKARKSWLVHDLAVSLENGIDWLGMATRQCRVLIIDNELRLATIKRRLGMVYEAKGIEPSDNLCIESARGRKLTIEAVPALVRGGNFDVIILDALYRFFPPGFVENDNGCMTQLYHELDEVATETGAAIIIVHHTSKGSQAIKSITDVGSGASAQSRAADVHMVLRPLSQTGDTAKETKATLDLVCRSFAPKERLILDWCYPLWTASNVADAPIQALAKEQITAKFFADRFVNEVWESKSEIVERAVKDGLSERKALDKFKDALDTKLIIVDTVIDGKRRNKFYKKPLDTRTI
jgi:cytidylate kinase